MSAESLRESIHEYKAIGRRVLARRPFYLKARALEAMRTTDEVIRKGRAKNWRRVQQARLSSKGSSPERRSGARP